MKQTHSKLRSPAIAACVIAFTLVITACAGTTTTDITKASETTTASPATTPATTELVTTVTDFVGEKEGGAVVLIVRDGVTSTAAVGSANAFGGALDASTPFRVGSISKPLIATMVMQMVDEGSVSLDHALATYLPDTPVGADVTIRSLLSHTSGLPNYTERPGFFTDVLAEPERTYASEEVLAYVAEVPTDATGQFSYSNTNYILLGQLIEYVDGSSLNDSLQNRVADPLGLDVMSFVGGAVTDPENLAGGWSQGISVGGTAAYESISSSAWAAGALVATAEELQIFITALFNGELISAAALEKMTDTEANGYGFGILATELGAGNPGFAHNGAIPGYSSMMGISPESGDVIVILTNNEALIADLLAPEILRDW